IAAAEIWDRIMRFFERRLDDLTSAGIDIERIVLDPGMGYFLSSQPQASLRVLANLWRLKRVFNLPVLVSVSRKSFLRLTTGRNTADAGPATLAAELCAMMAGADYIRTHDPAALRDGIRVMEAAAAQAERILAFPACAE